ncbi:transmembrane 9 superfamily member 1-like [Lingula anatina]|uniref:Transmembrane 9 superfamily member n=1 Tax=Lingula anatina TaxID=7574 RepID=A0A2R2MIH3_LINAN|nr:transmembrane 9 superfamily member 1-like [Lingula anatina]|eukprot:XP_023930008.1 transmembrane 9 superfamily member 1-like [Lingula anatina]
MAVHRTLVVLAILSSCLAEKYKDGAKVEVYVNKVGPYFNPHETYHYYQLPVCRPQKIEHKSLSLGEVLDGDRMAKSLYDIRFKKNISPAQELCKTTLSEADLAQLKEAIEDLYYFEFVLDNIPVRGFLGHLEEGGFLPHNHKVQLWTNIHFNIQYNGDQIIYANISTKEHEPVNLDDAVAPFEIRFTYSVKWHPTKLKYSDRDKLVKGTSFFPKTLEIHWLSIINSLVLVFLLLGFVVIILTRVLKNDFARYNTDDEDGEELDNDDNGWKIIHTDVFRFPPCKSLFCAILGELTDCNDLQLFIALPVAGRLDRKMT